MLRSPETQFSEKKARSPCRRGLQGLSGYAVSMLTLIKSSTQEVSSVACSVEKLAWADTEASDDAHHTADTDVAHER